MALSRFHGMTVALVVIALLGLSCIKHGSKRTISDATNPQNSSGNASAMQLKGANLLAQSLYRTLGPNKDISTERDQRGNEVRLFDQYSQNFGNTDGLRFGEIYPDSPSSGYFLALAIVADNAARQCQTEASANAAQTLCRCDTLDDARAMLDRAVPHAGFAKGTNPDLTRKFFERCQADYVGAVSSLVSSLAFAVRQ